MKRTFLLTIAVITTATSLMSCGGNHAPPDPNTSYQKISALDADKTVG